MRAATIDRQLMTISACLMFFGLLTLYSAGQTDVPTRAAGVWYRQFFWFGIGMVAGGMVFHLSVRLLEWLAPALYGFSLACSVWCWLSAPEQARHRAVIAGSLSAVIRSDSRRSWQRSRPF